MINDFKRRATHIFWSYRIDFGNSPMAFFSNPKIKTSVIYSFEEIRSILKRSDQENAFIPIPRAIMQNVLELMDEELSVSA